MKPFKTIVLILIATLIGVILGGYLFSDTRPRSFLAATRCEGTCFKRNELGGLLASVGIHKFPALIPSVVRESDRTIVIEHPAPEAPIHYVLIPKTDIKNIAEFSDADRDSLIDVFKVVREIIKEKGLVHYRVVTNGPGYQGVTYLHFHLTAK